MPSSATSLLPLFCLVNCQAQSAVVTDLVSSGWDELSRQGATPREWGRISCSVYESFRKIPRCATFLSSGPPSSPTFRRRLAREPNLPSPTSGGSVRTSRANGAAVDGPPRRFSEPILARDRGFAGNCAARSRPARCGPAGKKRQCRPAAAGVAKSCRPAVPTAHFSPSAPSVAKSARPHHQYTPLSSSSPAPVQGPNATHETRLHPRPLLALGQPQRRRQILGQRR